MESETEKFRNYFLGYLDEGETVDLEAQIISAPDIFEDLIEAENDLIDDYVDGALNEEQARRFLAMYATTAKRSENIEFVKAFREYAAGRNLRPRQQTSRTSAFFHQLKSLFWTRPKLSFGCLLVVGICGLALCGLYIRDRVQSASLQKEYAVLNSQDLADLERFGDLPAVAIFPGSVRGTSPAAGLLASSPHPNVLLRLVLTSATKDISSFDLILKKDDHEIFSLTSVQPYSAAGGREIRVLVPRDVLRKGKGKTKITVTSVLDSAVTETYFLIVE